MTTSPSHVAPSTASTPPMYTPLDIPPSPPHIPDVPPLASLPPPNEGEIGSLMASLTDGSSNSSMEISHSSLYPEDELATGPSSPKTDVDLSALIADIQDDMFFQIRGPYPLLRIDPPGISRKALGKGCVQLSAISMHPRSLVSLAPASQTQARRPDVASPSIVPPSFPIPKT
ncbi:hypothetical protein HAX54_045530 [Datura stramonium]|uniref:Uncharacterized protein n=1 Tax=Datura stramonium TaxID=4076 RepID=A0ABS8SS59_DATST|nr:hypothetical protein [Datura stramonium]